MGPYYAGVRGKLRFLRECSLWRKEIVFVAEPEGFGRAPRPAGPALELHPVREFANLEPFRSDLDTAYYPGYVEAFRAPFSWGEEAVLGLVDGRVASFAWMQFGTPDGFPTYYGRLFPGEARILRVGVAPAFRRGGVNTRMIHRLLERLFSGGVTRVYIECFLHNLPSVRTFLRTGFRPVGVLTVLPFPPGGSFVRWGPERAVAEALRELGIEPPGEGLRAGASLPRTAPTDAPTPP